MTYGIYAPDFGVGEAPEDAVAFAVFGGTPAAIVELGVFHWDAIRAGDDDDWPEWDVQDFVVLGEHGATVIRARVTREMVPRYDVELLP